MRSEISDFRFPLLPALLALLFFAFPAHAQAPKKIPPVEISGVDLGWDGIIPGDRWCPVTVWVTSREKAFSGTLVVEYPQDPTQITAIKIPLATTPGKITPIEVAVALPIACPTLSFTIYDDRGREQASWKYADNNGADGLSLPHIGAHAGLVLSLGDSTARLSVGRNQLANPEDNAGPKKSPGPSPTNYLGYQPGTVIDLWDQVQLARIKLDHLPLSWAAYEGVDALVAQAEDLAKADARAKAALMEWVLAGGRLVIRADPASDWRSFLPAGPDGEFITLDPLQRIIAGSDLTSLVRKDSPGDPATGPARLIHLTPFGQSRGWTLSWLMNSDNSGLRASGPVGLGIVTILGFEPQSLPAVINPATTRLLWRESITRSLAPHALHASYGNASAIYYGGLPDDDYEIATAVHTALDQAATIPPLSMNVFIAIAACMMLLALLIGPFDARVLKRLKRSQQSWLTALLWIGTASVAAYLVPNAIRSGQTMANRISAADVICDIDGIPRQTCQTSVTGIFGGRPITAKIENAPAGTWFRGVSSLSPYFTRTRSLFSPLTLPITVQDSDPYLRGTPPEPVSVSQWTFRGLLDQGPMRIAKGTDVGAKVRAQSDGTWEVTLINVPAEIQSTSATLHIGDHDYAFVLDSHDNTPANRLHDLRGIAVAPPTPAPAPVSTSDQTTTTTAAAVITPGISVSPTANLPGVRDRADAIEALLASGHWACVTVTLPLPMDITLSKVPDLETSRTASLRLLTPVESTP